MKLKRLTGRLAQKFFWAIFQTFTGRLNDFIEKGFGNFWLPCQGCPGLDLGLCEKLQNNISIKAFNLPGKD